jgi:hypothetical protein
VRSGGRRRSASLVCSVGENISLSLKFPLVTRRKNSVFHRPATCVRGDKLKWYELALFSNLCETTARNDFRDRSKRDFQSRTKYEEAIEVA